MVEQPDLTWPNRALGVLAPCQRVLMLQGPIGPFFHDLHGLLSRRGTEVQAFAFNAGDAWYHPQARWFQGDLDAWRRELQTTLARFRPQACLVFGQDRPVHAVARRLLEAGQVPLLVFEEGYVRPHFVTFEVDGVNARSGFQASAPPSANPSLGTAAIPTLPSVPPFQLPFRHVARLAMSYQVLARTSQCLTPTVAHHRSLRVAPEAWAWMKSGVIKTWAPHHARCVQARLCTPEPRPYFLVPLQVHTDAQLLHHSPYGCITEFIEEVVGSFARHAGAQAHLVIKHHPMDRGHHHHGALIARVLKRHGGHALSARVHYVKDGHLPTQLAHAQGTVLINSTVGLSSLFHGTPVLALGQAIYRQPGLTHPGPLDPFWQAPGEVDAAAFVAFQHALMAHTQLPGTFYWKAGGYGGLLEAMGQRLGRCAEEAGEEGLPEACGAVGAWEGVG